MAHKQLLHELLKQSQEPFHLKSYIADKRSQLNNSAPATDLQVKKRNPVAGEISTKRRNLSRNGCFFSFKNSADVGKPPFLDFQPPVISPCKSPAVAGAVFLHVPSKTAALLVEAAIRIQKQQQSKPKSKIKNVEFSLVGSFLKILKNRSKNRVLKNYGGTEKGNSQREFDEINEDSALPKARFSLHKSPSSSGRRRTPEFRSPAASPIRRRLKQEKENCATGEDSDCVHEVEEEKERFSPVSVIDAFFEDDAHESVDDVEGDDYDRDCSYANIERARQQLLNRLRRFERLAALDPIELEQKLMEDSDDDYQVRECVESADDHEQFSLCRDNNQSLDSSNLGHNPAKRVVISDLIIEEKCKIILSGNKEVSLARIRDRLDSWRVEFGVVDMMVELDFKFEFELGRENFPEEVEEMAEEIELVIFGVLVEELSDEFALHG